MLTDALYREALIISVKASPVGSPTAQQSGSTILLLLENCIVVNITILVARK